MRQPCVFTLFCFFDIFFFFMKEGLFVFLLGRGLPYESDGDARRLAWGYKLQILVSLRVHRTESQYFRGFSPFDSYTCQLHKLTLSK